MPEFECGDLMTVEKFRAYVEMGGFIDYDGFGCPVKNGEVDHKVYIYPSEVDKIQKDVTHILWFNR